MINHDHITTIVRETLHNMGVHEPSVEALVKGTFLMQSNLTELFDHSNTNNKRHGLMMISDKMLTVMVNEDLRYNLIMIEKIENGTGIDIRDWGVTEIADQLETNITFMVALTYCFYSLKYLEAPDFDLLKIGGMYRMYMIETGDVSIDVEFADRYNEIFLT